MRPRAERSPHKALHGILLFVVCFVCYGNTIGNDYAYDDAVVITENKFTSQGLAGIPDIFKHNTFAGGYEDVPLLKRYRPLSLASFAIERGLFGANPHVSHFINILLLALTTWLLLAFLRRLLAHREDAGDLIHLPFLAALLFAVHPVHTEIVANIKGRDEMLVLAGALSAMLLVLKFLEGRRPVHLLLAFVAFAIALFSKENAITFLILLPLTIFYGRKATARDHLLALLPLVLASAAFLGVMGLVLAGPTGSVADDILTDPFALASPSQRFATIVASLGSYLRLLVFPHPLTIDYQLFHIKLVGWGSIVVWLSLLAYLALLAYAIRGLGKRSLVAYGILFYLITLSVVSNLPFSTGTLLSERFMYLPSVGFVIVVARGLADRRCWQSLAWRRGTQAVVAILVLACALKTHARNAVWKDDFTLLTTDAQTSHESVKANMAAAVAYLIEANRPDRESSRAEHRAHALAHAKQAVAVYERNLDASRRKGSSYQGVMMLLGNAYSENGQLPEALGCYRAIMEGSAPKGGLDEMIQTTINKSDDVGFRLKGTLEFASLAPDSFTFNYHLGLIYGKDLNDLPMAIAYFKKAVDLAPDDGNALRGLGHAYSLAGDFEQAALCFHKLADRNPTDPSFLRSLFDLYRRAGNTAKQEEVARRLQSLAE